MFNTNGSDVTTIQMWPCTTEGYFYAVINYVRSAASSSAVYFKPLGYEYADLQGI